tara:strand:+ start:63 stop:251 length:189 start_codon:yes stop_codon:yes gene_type:complete
MELTTIWMFIFYLVGTLIGISLGYKRGVKAAAELTIDSLIEQGIVKWSVDSDGEINIHKWDE